jgi:class 3 adenylate cyclase
MNSIEVAHLRIQGQDFVFVPLSSQFKAVSAPDKQALLKQLRDICRGASLGGDVVIVWPSDTGVGFLADNRFHAVLSKSLTLSFVRANLNKKLASPGVTGLLAQLVSDPFGVAAPRPELAPAVPQPAVAEETADPGHRSIPTINDRARKAAGNRVVTMLFTDLVGSTKLKQEYGDARAMQLVRHHHDIVRKALSRTPSGEEVSTSGDSFFIAFATPSEAAMFALVMQSMVDEMNSSEGTNIQDRIGIHVGEVYVDYAKVAGKTFDLNGIQVDTASRIMSLAQGKQILLSRFAFDNAYQMLNGQDIDGVDFVAWRNHGYYEIKGVQAPIEICEVGQVGFAPLRPPPDSEKAKRSVAQSR